MTVLNFYLEKREIWGCVPIKEEETEFLYLCKCFDIIKEFLPQIPERAILGMAAELFMDHELEIPERDYLYQTFIRPISQNFTDLTTNYFTLSDKERTINFDKELQLSF